MGVEEDRRFEAKAAWALAENIFNLVEHTTQNTTDSNRRSAMGITAIHYALAVYWLKKIDHPNQNNFKEIESLSKATRDAVSKWLDENRVSE